MKNLKTIKVIELSPSECRNISANGWIIGAIGVVIAYIADDWADFKQGFADGWATINEK
ncbi:MAG: hypothetical protein K9H49_12945 [Bacteroidales bacterium]|nr:hypothetical protein [Bacteroidales bacterium]MCF8390404.1 hypothetical protein [Bacteroidales bacterium]